MRSVLADVGRVAPLALLQMGGAVVRCGHRGSRGEEVKVVRGAPLVLLLREETTIRGRGRRGRGRRRPEGHCFLLRGRHRGRRGRRGHLIEGGSHAVSERDLLRCRRRGRR